MGFEGDSQNAIAVVVIDNEDVVVAVTGRCHKFACEVHVGLTGGLHHDCIAVMGAVIVVKGRWKGIIVQRLDSGEGGQQVGVCRFLGGPEGFVSLVQVALDHGLRERRMFSEGLQGEASKSGDMATLEGLLKGGEGQAEKGGVRKGNKISSGGTTKCGMGGHRKWLADI